MSGDDYRRGLVKSRALSTLYVPGPISCNYEVVTSMDFRPVFEPVFTVVSCASDLAKARLRSLVFFLFYSVRCSVTSSFDFMIRGSRTSLTLHDRVNEMRFEKVGQIRSITYLAADEVAIVFMVWPETAFDSSRLLCCMLFFLYRLYYTLFVVCTSFLTCVVRRPDESICVLVVVVCHVKKRDHELPILSPGVDQLETYRDNGLRDRLAAVLHLGYARRGCGCGRGLSRFLLRYGVGHLRTFISVHISL